MRNRTAFNHARRGSDSPESDPVKARREGLPSLGAETMSSRLTRRTRDLSPPPVTKTLKPQIHLPKLLRKAIHRGIVDYYDNGDLSFVMKDFQDLSSEYDRCATDVDGIEKKLNRHGFVRDGDVGTVTWWHNPDFYGLERDEWLAKVVHGSGQTLENRRMAKANLRHDSRRGISRERDHDADASLDSMVSDDDDDEDASLDSFIVSDSDLDDDDDDDDEESTQLVRNPRESRQAILKRVRSRSRSSSSSRSRSRSRSRSPARDRRVLRRAPRLSRRSSTPEDDGAGVFPRRSAFDDVPASAPVIVDRPETQMTREDILAEIQTIQQIAEQAPLSIQKAYERSISLLELLSRTVAIVAPSHH